MQRLTNQRGATLAVALVLLLLLSILGVAATQVGIMEEKMTGNSRDKELSFQATESAVVQGEKWIGALTSQQIPSSGCTAPCVRTLDNTINFAQQAVTWWATNAGSYTTAALAGISSAPRYYIEFNRFVPDNPTIGHGQTSGIYYYRVTGRGSGGSDTAATVIQTTVAKRL